MRHKYTELLKNLELSFIAGFLPNMISFLMIPLYTRCLSTADYGTVDLIFNTSQLLMPILTIQIQDAMMRFAMDQSCDRCEVFSTGVRITLAGFVLLLAGCLVVGICGIIPLSPVYLLFLLITYLTGALNNIFSYFCRGIDEVRVLAVGSILNIVFMTSLNLLFLLKLKWGVIGYLTANIVGVSVNAAYLVFGARLYRYFHWKARNRQLFHDMTAFCIPLIFSSLSWWINNASDKYILTFFHGVSVVGMYAAAYKVPTILKVFSDIIAMAFSISAIKEFDHRDSDGFIGRSYSMISLFMTLCCSTLMLLNVFIAKILFAGAFFEAWRCAPPLLFSVLMNQLSLSCENILVGAKKTKTISQTAIAGALVNTAANFILIPFFGAYGAAVATAIGFTCFWALRYHQLKKWISLKNHLPKECASYLILVVQAAFAYFGNRFWYIQQLLLLLIPGLYSRELLQLARSAKKIHR